MAEELAFRIHPAVGVARVGDAPDDFFVGPEIPGAVPSAPFPSEGHIRHQAARFRVFAYRRVQGKWVAGEEVLPGVGIVRAIRWRVHLANRKASFFEFNGLQGEPGKYHDGQDMPQASRRNAGDPTAWDIDPGAKTISGIAAAPVRFDVAGGGAWPKNVAGVEVIDYLGELRTDDAGRLLVLGGRGRSGSTQIPPAALPHYANNATWLDDISDGPVTAEIVVGEGVDERVIPVGRDGHAWCIVAPPDFAPEITSAVTLYDLLVDVAARRMTLSTEEAVYDGPLAWLKQLNDELRTSSSLNSFRPDYVRDVFPLLERAIQFGWVTRRAANVHATTLGDPILADPSGVAEDPRRGVVARLRVPGAAALAGRTMPRLLGDEPYDDHPEAPNRRRLAITRTQYAILERWRDGHFDAPAVVPAPGASHAPDPDGITPHGLDRAALDACVGGAFYPGIEAGWQLRHEDLFIAPFRIDHAAASTYLGDAGTVAAGHFSRQMAVPWQADFMDCKEEQHNDGRWGWWPSQRPDDVRIEGGGATMQAWARGGDSHEWMVANWFKLGFVIRVDGTDRFEERERDGTLP